MSGHGTAKPRLAAVVARWVVLAGVASVLPMGAGALAAPASGLAVICPACWAGRRVSLPVVRLTGRPCPAAWAPRSRASPRARKALKTSRQTRTATRTPLTGGAARRARTACVQPNGARTSRLGPGGRPARSSLTVRALATSMPGPGASTTGRTRTAPGTPPAPDTRRSQVTWRSTAVPPLTPGTSGSWWAAAVPGLT
jgi:hypothetical protein